MGRLITTGDCWQHKATSFFVPTVVLEADWSGISCFFTRRFYSTHCIYSLTTFGSAYGICYPAHHAGEEWKALVTCDDWAEEYCSEDARCYARHVWTRGRHVFAIFYSPVRLISVGPPSSATPSTIKTGMTHSISLFVLGGSVACGLWSESSVENVFGSIPKLWLFVYFQAYLLCTMSMSHHHHPTPAHHADDV
jgi:hypothetical protein